MNIIIVDDDKLVSLSLKTILEASGEVNVCAIGNCAILTAPGEIPWK